MPDLARKLERLNAAVRELTTAASSDDLLQKILTVVEKVFGRNTAALLLREPDGERLKIVAARGYEPQAVASYDGRVGRGVAGSVAATGKPRLVADVSREPDYVRGVSAAVSEMAVPLVLDGQVIGVLDVESSESAFGEEDMALLVAFGEQAAWAMRHRRTMAELEKRALRMSLLNRTAREINKVHDPELLLSRILELAHQALGFHSVAVLVADRCRRQLVVRQALNRQDIVGVSIPIDRGVSGTVFCTGQAEIVADVRSDPRYIEGGLSGPRSEMTAPLQRDGEIIGVLDAEAEGIGAFDQLDLEVFSAFAAHVATALHNARLLAAAEERARRLKLLARTGRALCSLLSTAEIIDEILRGADDALGLGRAALLLVDEERRSLVIHAARGYGDVIGQRIPLGTGVTGHVAITGTPALVNDTSAEPRYLPGIERGASEMAVPLQLFGEMIGVLDTESPELSAFSEGDLELFATFADQAAVAIHNARIFSQLEEANAHLKRNVEEMARLNRELDSYAREIAQINDNLELQVRQLTTLHQAGRAITSSLDLDQTLSAILTMTGEIIKSSSGAIKLIDEETKELRIRAQRGTPREGSGPVCVCGLPLKVGERTIGVFELVREATGEIGETEQRLLETLASQAAIAIENARLFEGTQRTYYETLKSLATALETRDDYTRGHSERVAQLSVAVARRLDLDESACGLIYNSALLHDIGKIGIRDAVLLKPRQLTEAEMETIRRHPAFGSAILRPLKFLGEVAELVNCHHERWDGSGYPRGLGGESIPLGSRIIGVADAYDAMTSNRPYRQALTREEAIAELRRQVGRQFDPDVLAAFLETIARDETVSAPAEQRGARSS